MHNSLRAHDRISTLASNGLPDPRQLAELGAVLCLYRPQHGSELTGWMQADRVEVHAGLDSDGLRESLVFLDRAGRCCWQLWLLPDSDFLAWDRMAATLPGHRARASAAGISERLWHRLANRLTGDAWRACALRLHAMREAEAAPVLAASPVALSALGTATARDILRAQEADFTRAWDACCCAQAAAAAADRTVAAPVDPILRLSARSS